MPIPSDEIVLKVRHRITLRLLYLLFRLRYKIRIQGIDELKRIETPILYLFEHPAQVDAFIHMSLLAQIRAPGGGKLLLPRYLAASDFASRPIISDLLGPVMMPVPSGPPGDRRKIRVQHLINDVISSLKRGVNVAMSPVGALIRQDGRTRLGNKSGAAKILQGLDRGEVTVATIEVDGLYGSVTSRAHTGESPTGKALLAAALAFIKGGLILSRRREITIAFTVQDLPIGEAASVEAVNTKLEAIFNKTRRPVFTPYNRFPRQSLPDLVPASTSQPSPTEIGRPCRLWSRRLSSLTPNEMLDPRSGFWPRFIEVTSTHSHDPIFYQPEWGTMTRRELSILLLALAREIRELPGERLGYLLPCSLLNIAIYFAANLAGKQVIPCDPLASGEQPPVDKVLSSESYLDELEEQGRVFQQWERDRSFFEVTTLLNLRSVITASRFYLLGGIRRAIRKREPRFEETLPTNKLDLQPNDRLLFALPLHHDPGRAIITRALLEPGIRIALPPRPLSPSTAIPLVRQLGINKVALPPSFANELSLLGADIISV